ncbi:hypothetical protein Plhal304r1_c077g0164141 [Plasmopara halstedii]
MKYPKHGKVFYAIKLAFVILLGSERLVIHTKVIRAHCDTLKGSINRDGSMSWRMFFGL